MHRKERNIHPRIDLQDQERNYIQHLQQIQNAKPTIDTKPPERVLRIEVHKKSRQRDYQVQEAVSKEIYGLIASTASSQHSPKKSFSSQQSSRTYNSPNKNTSPQSNRSSPLSSRTAKRMMQTPNILDAEPSIHSSDDDTEDIVDENGNFINRSISDTDKDSDINDNEREALDSIINKKIQKVKRKLNSQTPDAILDTNTTVDLPPLYNTPKERKIIIDNVASYTISPSLSKSLSKTSSPQYDQINNSNEQNTPSNLTNSHVQQSIDNKNNDQQKTIKHKLRNRKNRIKFLSSDTDDTSASEYLTPDDEDSYISNISGIELNNVKEKDSDVDNLIDIFDGVNDFNQNQKNKEKRSKTVYNSTPSSRSTRNSSPIVYTTSTIRNIKNAPPLIEKKERTPKEASPQQNSGSSLHNGKKKVKKYRRVRKQTQSPNQSPEKNISETSPVQEKQQPSKVESKDIEIPNDATIINSSNKTDENHTPLKGGNDENNNKLNEENSRKIDTPLKLSFKTSVQTDINPIQLEEHSAQTELIELKPKEEVNDNNEKEITKNELPVYSTTETQTSIIEENNTKDENENQNMDMGLVDIKDVINDSINSKQAQEKTENVSSSQTEKESINEKLQLVLEIQESQFYAYENLENNDDNLKNEPVIKKKELPPLITIPNDTIDNLSNNNNIENQNKAQMSPIEDLLFRSNKSKRNQPQEEEIVDDIFDIDSNSANNPLQTSSLPVFPPLLSRKWSPLQNTQDNSNLMKSHDDNDSSSGWFGVPMISIQDNQPKAENEGNVQALNDGAHHVPPNSPVTKDQSKEAFNDPSLSIIKEESLSSVDGTKLSNRSMSNEKFVNQETSPINNSSPEIIIQQLEDEQNSIKEREIPHQQTPKKENESDLNQKIQENDINEHSNHVEIKQKEENNANNEDDHESESNNKKEDLNPKQQQDDDNHENKNENNIENEEPIPDIKSKDIIDIKTSNDNLHPDTINNEEKVKQDPHEGSNKVESNQEIIDNSEKEKAIGPEELEGKKNENHIQQNDNNEAINEMNQDEEKTGNNTSQRGLKELLIETITNNEENEEKQDVQTRALPPENNIHKEKEVKIENEVKQSDYEQKNRPEEENDKNIENHNEVKEYEHKDNKKVNHNDEVTDKQTEMEVNHPEEEKLNPENITSKINQIDDGKDNSNTDNTNGSTDNQTASNEKENNKPDENDQNNKEKEFKVVSDHLSNNNNEDGSSSHLINESNEQKITEKEHNELENSNNEINNDNKEIVSQNNKEKDANHKSDNNHSDNHKSEKNEKVDERTPNDHPENIENEQNTIKEIENSSHPHVKFEQEESQYSKLTENTDISKQTESSNDTSQMHNLFIYRNEKTEPKTEKNDIDNEKTHSSSSISIELDESDKLNKTKSTDLIVVDLEESQSEQETPEASLNNQAAKPVEEEAKGSPKEEDSTSSFFKEEIDKERENESSPQKVNGDKEKSSEKPSQNSFDEKINNEKQDQENNDKQDYLIHSHSCSQISTNSDSFSNPNVNEENEGAENQNIKERDLEGQENIIERKENNSDVHENNEDDKKVNSEEGSIPEKNDSNTKDNEEISSEKDDKLDSVKSLDIDYHFKPEEQKVNEENQVNNSSDHATKDQKDDETAEKAAPDTNQQEQTDSYNMETSEEKAIETNTPNGLMITRIQPEVEKMLREKRNKENEDKKKANDRSDIEKAFDSNSLSPIEKIETHTNSPNDKNDDSDKEKDLEENEGVSKKKHKRHRRRHHKHPKDIEDDDEIEDQQNNMSERHLNEQNERVEPELKSLEIEKQDDINLQTPQRNDDSKVSLSLPISPFSYSPVNDRKKVELEIQKCLEVTTPDRKRVRKKVKKQMPHHEEPLSESPVKKTLVQTKEQLRMQFMESRVVYDDSPQSQSPAEYYNFSKPPKSSRRMRQTDYIPESTRSATGLPRIFE